MQICRIEQKNNYYKNPNFEAMKASQFKGVDYAVMRKFKAPIEKFDTMDDFYFWAKRLIKEISYQAFQNFAGRNSKITEQRKDLLYKWFYHFTNNPNTYTPAMFLLTFAAITKNLKPNTDTLPPELNEIALTDSFVHIEHLMSQKDNNFDFYKVYQNKLRKIYLDIDSPTKYGEGKYWLKIPSKEHDPENFKANVKKVQNLSYRAWCTTNLTNAEKYLQEGDFCIFFDKETPKVAIKLVGDTVREIQGELNNGEFPLRYFEECMRYINQNKLKSDKIVIEEITTALHKREILQKYEDAIKNQDFDKLLHVFDISFTKDKDGFYTLYGSNVIEHGDITPYDLNLDVDALFKKVKILNAKEDTTSPTYNLASYATSLGAIEEINDDLFLVKQLRLHFKDLGKLKRVNGYVDLNGTSVRTLGQLESIEGNLYLKESYVTDLSGIKDFKGNLVQLNLLQLLNPKNIFFIIKHIDKIVLEKNFGPIISEKFDKIQTTLTKIFPWLE